MTIILRRLFTVRHLTQIPVKYMFPESFIIVDYGGMFINLKKIKVFIKYSALFLKVHFRSDLSGRTRLISLWPL